MLQLKRGDTLPSLEITITDDGYPVDLTGAVVRVIGSMQGGAVVFDEVITGDVTGKVIRDWKEGDTSTAGLMLIETVVTWPAGTRTFPVPGFAEVKITETGPRPTP